MQFYITNIYIYIHIWLAALIHLKKHARQFEYIIIQSRVEIEKPLKLPTSV